MKETNFLIFMAIIDIAFLVDILICFRTSVLNHEGKEVTDSVFIAMKYIKGSFVIDFIAGIPLEILIP